MKPCKHLLSATTAGVLAIASTLFAAPAYAIVIGGFTADRGGFESLQPAAPSSPALLSPYTGAAENSGLADAIAASLPGTTFSFADTLTPVFLSGVDAVILGVGTGLFNAITPLSSAEQGALFNFVLDGGTALIFADNATFDPSAPAANASLLDPFGVTITGILAPGTAPLLHPSGPLTGPFKPVSDFTYGYTGYFTDTNGGEVLAEIGNDPALPDVDYFAPHALGPESGEVVLFADSDAMVVGETTANVNLILNALPQPVPEPGTLTMLPAFFLGFWVMRVVRRQLRSTIPA